MHTKCCKECSWVTHCFGALLNSTGMIEVILDTWHMLDIVPNVAKWYEDQIRTNQCVVVLVSPKMFLRSIGLQGGQDYEDRKLCKSLVACCVSLVLLFFAATITPDERPVLTYLQPLLVFIVSMFDSFSFYRKLDVHLHVHTAQI